MNRAKTETEECYVFYVLSYIVTPINLFPPTELFSLINFKWFSRNPWNTEKKSSTNIIIQYYNNNNIE